VGTGFARKAHMPALPAIKNVHIVAVTSAPFGKCAIGSGRVWHPHSYDDWRVMLATQNLDLVCVSRGAPVLTSCATHRPQWMFIKRDRWRVMHAMRVVDC